MPDAAISEPDDHTVMDAGGAVRSIQAANVTMPEGELEELWTPLYLERLARTYWKYLSRVSLGLIRVEYTPTRARASCCCAGRSSCCASRAPEYDISDGRGIVRWRIRDGVLVASATRATWRSTSAATRRRSPATRRRTSRSRSRTSTRRSRPAIARWFYKMTQSRIHVLVTHGFLRSLARRELEASAVGRFATNGERAPVNVGETPWPVVGALVAAFVGAVVLLWRFIRSGR